MLKCRLSAVVLFAETNVGHLCKFIVQVACMIVCKCDEIAAHTSCPTNAANPPKPFLLQAGGSQHCCGKCVCVVERRAWATLRCANLSCCMMLISCLTFFHPDANLTWQSNNSFAFCMSNMTDASNLSLCISVLIANRCSHCSCGTDLGLQVEPHPKDFGKSLGAALDFNFQEHMGMLNQLVGLMGALPVHKEDSPQMTFKRWVFGTAASLMTHSSSD